MPSLISVLGVALLSMMVAAQDTIELLRADVYLGSATCSGTPRSVPFGVSGACNTLGNNFSWRINCTSSSRDVFASRDCSGGSVAAPFQCIEGTQGQAQNRPATSFSCASYPKNRVVVMTLSTGTCPTNNSTGRALPSITYSYALIVNTCLPLPRNVNENAGTEGSGHYKIAVAADGTITFRRWENFLCVGEPASVVVGRKNRCTTVTGGGGSSRLLQTATSVSFETIDASGNLEVESAGTVAVSATMLSLLSILVAFFAIY
jgi:hypothetical protein